MVPNPKNPRLKGLFSNAEIPLPNKDWSEFAETLINQILALGIDGRGPWKGAEEIAEEHLRHHKDREKAISRLIATHMRNTGVAGLAAGIGGILTLPATLPADVVALYSNQIRMTAAIAYLRGYDIYSEEVKSIITLTLLGSAGTAMAADMGVKIGQKSAMAAIRRVPGRVLLEINRKVGFRLVTRAGTTGVFNLSKAVPVVGGVVGGGINAGSTRTTGAFAKKNFPSLHEDDDIMEGEIVTP